MSKLLQSRERLRTQLVRARSAIASLVFLSLFGSGAIAQGGTRYPQLADSLWRTVNSHFYDPHFRGADWPAVRTRFEASARRVSNDAEFAALADSMLAVIGSSHLYIRPPRVAGQSTVAPARRCDVVTLDVERPNFGWSRLDTASGRGVGYIRADRFDDGAAGWADEAMRDLRDARGIIIDVRNNSGGNLSAMRLGSYFGGEAAPGVVLLSRPYLLALGRPVTPADIARVPRVNGAYTTAAVFEAMYSNRGGATFWTDDLGENRYTGPVVVLIGERTGSAAEGFAWHMRERTRAKMVGRRTAGALLSSESFEIGDGWTVTIPVHGIWGPDGSDYGDRAVVPHVSVPLDREALCAGRDPDLEAALRLLKSDGQ